jgi:hypothetical protein
MKNKILNSLQEFLDLPFLLLKKLFSDNLGVFLALVLIQTFPALVIIALKVVIYMGAVRALLSLINMITDKIKAKA